MLLLLMNLGFAGGAVTAPNITILSTPYCINWNSGAVKWNKEGNVYTACWNRTKPTWSDV